MKEYKDCIKTIKNERYIKIKTLMKIIKDNKIITTKKLHKKLKKSFEKNIRERDAQIFYALNS